MDTYVVRLVLVVSVLAWGSVLLHDLVTDDAPAESAIVPAAASDEGEGSALRAPSLPAPTSANASAPSPPPP